MKGKKTNKKTTLTSISMIISLQLSTIIWALGELQYKDLDFVQRTFQLIKRPNFLSQMNARMFTGLVWGYSLLLEHQSETTTDDPFAEIDLINRTHMFAGGK